MKAVVIIPARMAATRFPGKPLAEICGLSMVGHCFLRASMAKLATQVYVATCDHEIAEEIYRLGGNVVITSSKHERASDRTAEALQQLQAEGAVIDVVTMLQGDEPLIHPDCIDTLIQHHIQNPNIAVFNLTQFINNEDDFYNVNTVKILTNLQSDILALSRAAIPSPCLHGLLGYKAKKQLGIISFRSEALLDFAQLPQTPLEKIESIDMMRLIEYGRSIKEVLTDALMQGVDTPEDAKKVERYMQEDLLYPQYKMMIEAKRSA